MIYLTRDVIPCEIYPEPKAMKKQMKYANNRHIPFVVLVGSDELKNGIDNSSLNYPYDWVSLLIGVNNQYQNISFSIYETEFPQLINSAISKAKGDKSNLIVVSIPDYAFTPFGNGNSNISVAIDRYNNFAENYCNANNISYIYITDITRLGLINPELVATDGLHPSELAYSKFVERILPLAIDKLRK